jgi:ribosomal protein S3
LGQKTHPIGFRLGINKTWNSKWFSAKAFADLVHEDLLIKKYINARLDNAGLAKVEITRAPKKVTVDIHTSRPGIVIGRRGAEVDKLREELQMLITQDISLNIIEVKKPELCARSDDENGRRRDQDCLQRASKRGGNRPCRNVHGRTGAVAHVAGRHRLHHGDGAHHLRNDWRQGLDLPRDDFGSG